MKQIEHICLYFSTRKHATGIGFQLSMTYFHVKDGKNIRLLQNHIPLATANAADQTLKNMKSVIQKTLKSLNIEILDDEEKKVKIVLTKNFQFNFDIKYKDEIKKFAEMVSEDFTQMRLYNNIQIKIDYKIHDEAYSHYVIIFREKHGDRHFIVNSTEQFYKVFLKMLTYRYNEKYWYDWMKDHKPYENPNKKKPTYTEEEVISMPESMSAVKEDMLKELKKWKTEETNAEEIRNRYKEIEKAVNEKNGVIAYKIMCDLKEGEYEKFQVFESEEY